MSAQRGEPQMRTANQIAFGVLLMAAHLLGGCGLFDSIFTKDPEPEPFEARPDAPKTLWITSPALGAKLKPGNPVVQWELGDKEETVDHVIINIYKYGFTDPYITVYDKNGQLGGSYTPGQSLPEGVLESWKGVGSAAKTMQPGKEYEIKILVVTDKRAQSASTQFEILKDS